MREEGVIGVNVRRTLSQRGTKRRSRQPGGCERICWLRKGAAGVQPRMGRLGPTTAELIRALGPLNIGCHELELFRHETHGDVCTAEGSRVSSAERKRQKDKTHSWTGCYQCWK